MVIKIVGGVLVVFLLVGFGTFVLPPPAQAEVLSWRERLDQIRAEAAARRQQRLEDRADATPDNNQNTPNIVLDNNGSEPCTCSATLKLAKPEVVWNSSGLAFVPRFDVRIRVRGNEQAGPWNLALNYDGQASYSSTDITPPAGSAFSGSDSWSGACFDTRATFSGHAGTPVSIASLSRGLFVGGNELAGLVKMKADLTGCDSDSEYRQFKFTVGDFGNLRTSSWRLAR